MTAGSIHQSNQVHVQSGCVGRRRTFGTMRDRIRAVILLAGLVRRTELSAKLRRAILNLPIDMDFSILDALRAQVAMLSRTLGVEKLPVRIIINRQAVQPTVRASDGQSNVRLEIDAGEYRGTGGVLRDASEEYGEDDWIVVANGNQMILESLDEMVALLAKAGGDVTLMSHQDGTPAGLMLLRCGALRLIPKMGFVDMKEQALPRIAAHHKVSVVSRRRPMGIPVRGRGDYLRALFQYHRSRDDGDESTSAFVEKWRPTFSVIEVGAEVDSSARIHDSVVLRGGRVESGAAVVHSVVCPGGVVARGQVATDQVVAANGRPRRRIRR
jgi:hypothetical protein